MSNNIDNQQNTEDHLVTNYIVGKLYVTMKELTNNEFKGCTKYCEIYLCAQTIEATYFC